MRLVNFKQFFPQKEPPIITEKKFARMEGRVFELFSENPQENYIMFRWGTKIVLGRKNDDEIEIFFINGYIYNLFSEK